VGRPAPPHAPGERPGHSVMARPLAIGNIRA
jgi:hypothetical protein